ncbi:N-acetylmuramoyl-L-alanine amidase [Candidatus Pacearchaeota archaeon]|nr:N-acetylmuramoyl-L-alanine amidase [Candidatus Pacearchaeota archaeon]
MRIPLRPSLLTIRRRTRWIILHHTAELYPAPESRIDNPKYQMPGLYKGVLEKKQADVNYHFVIDKVKEEFEVFTARPFTYICEWPDIPTNINNAALHVALMGSYDFKVPVKRCYEVLAYRLLNPLLKQYNIAPNRIKFHRDVSDNEDLTCPGYFIDEAIVISMVRRFVIK